MAGLDIDLFALRELSEEIVASTDHRERLSRWSTSG